MAYRVSIGRRLIAFATFVAAVSLVLVHASNAAELGATVTNVASLSHGPPGGRINADTPPASFIIEAARTPSTVQFFRFSPNAPDAQLTTLNGSEFSQTVGPDGAPVFQPIDPPSIAGGAPIDVASPVPLTPAENYFGGEVIFVQVEDAGQNGDPDQVETITARIVSETGDEILIMVFETGPDTGVFFGYFESSRQPTSQLDDTLTIAQGQAITATYQDPFDASEISTDVAGVDPFGQLFNSVTGELIDGVEVTIVDAATGQPAPVFGIDGVSAYPSTLVTGSSVTDASGLIYDLQPGEFVFPIMFPGEYRLVVTPPAGLSAPSSASQSQLDSLPGGPFVITPASFLNAFALDGTGDVNFDVPLDPDTTLVLTKEASAETGAIGDFIRYEINIDNSGDGNALLRVQDELPVGFRYQRGSARRDGEEIDDPVISPDGETLNFEAGVLPAGESASLTYVVEIGAGTPNGEAVNRAFVLGPGTGLLSNTGSARIFVEEDFFRSNLTIVGRVVADACNPETPWPREITDGEGVENVRLYLETGAYVTTDEFGLFHFEDVDAKRHVVQVDTASLPEGYEPVVCEESTRYAGSAISQFVDAQGGAVWRTNFYLRKTERAIALEAAAKAAQAPEAFNDALEYKEFDNTWLQKQNDSTQWLYPAEGRTPSTRAIHVGIKHANFTRVTLLLNGSIVPGTNFAGREVNLLRTVAVSRWRGVDLVDGENELVAIIRDQQDKEVDRITRKIVFVTEKARATYLPEQSRLVADGRTPPVVAVRLTDGAGRPVRAGELISVRIEPPYRARDLERLEDDLPLTAPLSALSPATIGPDGIALIELEPTLQTGSAKISVLLDGQREEEIMAVLQPELREWIVVGLAEGGLSYERDTRTDARDLLRDGRIAVFAKGAVKGDWLVTAAVDTDNSRGDTDDELFDDVDPDSRFPIFGDRSTQQFEAQSRFPAYLKVEKGAFQTTFGDYDSGLTDVELGKYARRLTGLQTVYEGERFRFRGFGAETNQDFVRDELAADGTSGPFQLSAAPVVRNAEAIAIETRNRFRPDEVLNVTPLVRYLDYDIDFQTGRLILRLPVPAAPDETSFNVLVVEYETAAPVERSLVGGGRGAFRFADGRGEVGATVIHEAGEPGAPDVSNTLAAADLRYDITETTRFRAEFGRTQRSENGDETHSDAILAEVEHVSDRATGRLYYDEREAGFGLGQQSSGVAGIRRYGGEARLQLSEFYADKNGAQGERAVEAAGYEEENLITGARRFVASLKLRHDGAFTTAAAGVRRVVEETADGVKRRALLVTSETRQHFEKIGLTLRASRDQPIGANEGIQFPKRTVYGFEQTLFKTVRLDVSHEIQESAAVNSANTIVGLSAEPWSGARLTVGADRITQDTGNRLGATFGVDQQVQISKRWSASFGVSRRQELGGEGEISLVDDIVADDPISPLENNEDFTSVFIGAGYRSETSQGSARFEMRKSLASTRYTGVLSAAREVTEALSYAGALRIEQNDNNNAADERRIDARLGLAWRPRAEGIIIFDRFDINQNVIDGELTSWRAVNNLGLNAMLDERWQVSLNHGIKYSQLNTGGDVFSGVTQLVGVETRYDITEQIDFGAHIMALYSHNSNTLDYAFGPSIGFNPADNVWLSAGWNIEGFVDDDFSAAEYARRGPFVRLRIKFDQNTAKGLLSEISPR